MRRKVGPRRWREHSFSGLRFSGGAKRRKSSSEEQKIKGEGKTKIDDSRALDAPLAEQDIPTEDKPVSSEGAPAEDFSEITRETHHQK